MADLDAAELLGTAQSGLWNDRDQVRFAERLNMQAHRGHRQIKSLRQLANGHGFVHQTFEDFQPGFRGKRLADFGGCFRIGKIQDDIFFVFNASSSYIISSFPCSRHIVMTVYTVCQISFSIGSKRMECK